MKSRHGLREALRGALRTAALGSSLFALPACAIAWSGRGHAMVADIATRLLTPTVSVEIDALLADDRFADGTPSRRTTLAQVASWPDELRGTSEQRATGVYHYDDIPVCGTASRSDYCLDGRCGSAWLTRQIAVLKDRSQPRQARNEALKWVTHLVGDLHQPLHASDYDDKGGNDVQINFLGVRADDPIGGRQQPPVQPPHRMGPARPVQGDRPRRWLRSIPLKDPRRRHAR